MQRVRVMIVLMCAALVAACSAAPAPTASTAPATSTAGAASAAPTALLATVAAEPSAEPTATPQPSAEVSSAAARPSLTLWYGYAEGSAEEKALSALVDRARPQLPETEIRLLRVPGAELVNRFEIEAVAGGGPDLLLTTNESLGRDVRAGLLRNLDAAAARANLDQASRDSMIVDGHIYGLPLSRSTVALYTNRAAVATPPASTQALLEAVKGGARAVFIRSAYYNLGFFGAFGGRLLDESGRCVADQGGVAEALAYLRELSKAGAQFVPSGRQAQELFRSGQADLTIDGDWLLADYRVSLGEQLAVAPLPGGPAGPARPLVISSGIVVSANSQQPEQAATLALALTDLAAQQELSRATQLIPASPEVTPADAALAAFASSAQSGLPRPQQAELDAFWQPLDAALGQVLDSDSDPAEAVGAACATINSVNGK